MEEQGGFQFLFHSALFPPDRIGIHKKFRNVVYRSLGFLRSKIQVDGSNHFQFCWIWILSLFYLIHLKAIRLNIYIEVLKTFS